MLFYQVNHIAADCDRYIKNRYGKTKIDGSFVLNELYTEKELSHFIHVNMNGFTAVCISKRKTYYFFGCRFACEEAI